MKRLTTLFTTILCSSVIFFGCSSEKVITPYEGLGGYGGDLAAFRYDDKWGYIDRDENLIIDNIYEVAWEFIDGAAIIRQHGKWGAIDTKGNTILEPKYEYAYVNEGYIEITENDLHGIANPKGDIVISTEYDYVHYVDHSSPLRFIAQKKIDKKNSKFSLFDINGKLISDTTYDYIDALPNGNFMVRKNDNYGVIDANGVTIIPLQFGRTYGFVDGIGLIQDRSSAFFVYHHIDTKGNKLDTIKDFETLKLYYSQNSTVHVASKEIGGEYALLDKELNPLTEYKYKYMTVERDLIIVEDTNATGALNAVGKEIIPLKYDFIHPLTDKIFVAEYEDYTHDIYDNNGNRLLDYTSNSIYRFESDYIVVENADEKYGLFDLEFNQILDFEYDYIEPGTNPGEKTIAVCIGEEYKFINLDEVSKNEK